MNTCKESPRITSATIGTDPNIPPEVRDEYLQEHAQSVVALRRRIADTLFDRLLIDGIESHIQYEDIERLASVGKSPEFMRSIVIELMLCLRSKA